MPGSSAGKLHSQATLDTGTVRLTFKIPLPACGSTGLGISVKGKTATSSQQHSTASQGGGIYIKSIMPGGAAAKVGRLTELNALARFDSFQLLSKGES